MAQNYTLLVSDYFRWSQQSKQRTGVVCAISKKGTVKLRNYGKWSEVIRIIKCNDINGDMRGRDSNEKKKVMDRKFIIVYY